MGLSAGGLIRRGRGELICGSRKGQERQQTSQDRMKIFTRKMKNVLFICLLIKVVDSCRIFSTKCSDTFRIFFVYGISKKIMS